MENKYDESIWSNKNAYTCYDWKISRYWL